jgi:hypothetical protein
VTAIASLHIGPTRTTLAAGTRQASIAVGAAGLARAHFERWPPTPLEMEHAIAVVEHALAAAADARLELREVETRDPGIGSIAAVAAAAAMPPFSLSRDAVEQAFNRLVDIAEGAPAAAPAPEPLEWAARLVILRELMHHWSIDAVTVR